MMHPDLQQWIEFAFDRPVRDPAWYWDRHAPECTLPPSRVAELDAETFERGEQLLASFSSGQLRQGLEYLTSTACSPQGWALVDPGVAEATRLRVVRSFVPLFETVMQRRCSPHLLHLDEAGADPLNAACYMWWEWLPFAPSHPDDGDRRFGGDRAAQARFDEQAMLGMARILDIPHDACRESALHGLGHWHLRYPQRSAAIIDRFLEHSPCLRAELRAYAEAARSGMVQ